jgi:predicted amidohydrolase YtcJ
MLAMGIPVTLGTDAALRCWLQPLASIENKTSGRSIGGTVLYQKSAGGSLGCAAM